MTTWKIDTVHSEISFKVKHLMISTVRGTFDSFEGGITADDDTFDNGKVHFKAEVASINTKNKQREGHLLSPDFFDVDHFPEVSFNSTSVKKVTGNELDITGDLTMKGVTKSVQLKATVNGIAKGLDANKVAGFHLTGEVNRKDFGIDWNAPLETGGVLVGESVLIEAFLEVAKV